MPRSRNSQMSLIDTPYYHCVTRCVLWVSSFVLYYVLSFCYCGCLDKRFSNEPMLVVPAEFGIRLEDHFYMTDNGPRWFTEPSNSIENPFGL